MEATTVLCIRHRGNVAIGGDGQVTLNTTVMKHTAKKIRKLYKDRCLAGFAGATADAFTLLRGLKRSWNSITETLPGPLWNWQRTGGQIDCSGGLRPF